jgi:signal recognition particle receptor subunit beta
MSDNKIIFAGPPGVGVTTAIKSISDTAPVIKEKKIVDDQGNTTTIEMDYGILKLDTGDEIHLYGTPDKAKYKYVQETLNKDCIGLIIFIDNTDTDPVGTMFQYMEDCQPMIEKKDMAVGLTRYEDSPSPDINDFHIALREKKLHIPVFTVDGHEKNDIITIIRALLYNLDSGVN